MAKKNATIERLQAEAGVVVPTTAPAPAPAKSKLDEAYEMFQDLLEEPNANAAKIGQHSEINSVAIGQLKNKTAKNITENMFGKLKGLYDAVKTGKVVFEATQRGRKAGTAVAAPTTPKPPKAPKPGKSPGRSKAKKQNVTIEAIMSEHKIVTAELIEQKKAELAKLTLEVQYLIDLKTLQDKYKK